MVAPCKDCNKRYYACHDTCKEYHAYRKWKDDDNAKRKMSWQSEWNWNHYRFGRKKT